MLDYKGALLYKLAKEYKQLELIVHSKHTSACYCGSCQYSINKTKFRRIANNFHRAHVWDFGLVVAVNKSCFYENVLLFACICSMIISTMRASGYPYTTSIKRKSNSRPCLQN